MERRRKLLATASSQGACTEFIVDRFRDLPDEIAHRILSFLTLRDLTRVGCVSNRCRELYLSIPSLNFDTSYFERLTMWKRLKLFNSFDRFLTNREDNKMQCLRICWTDSRVQNASQYDEPFRIFTWIRNAVSCNIEVLYLQLRSMRLTPLALPSCFFICRSLRSLHLDSGGDILKWPSSACLTNLQYLKLRNVNIVGEELFYKWISCFSKFLKELHLENVLGINYVTIESSSLESFSLVDPYGCKFCHLNISGEKLEDIHIRCIFGSPSSRSLNICAPNLKYLKWGGDLMNHQSLGNLMCLEKAEIFLKPEVDDFEKVFEVLCSIRRVKTLILNKETTKALREGFMPAPLDDISFFGMGIRSLSDDLVPALVSLLRRMTTLSTLCINYDPSLVCLNLIPGGYHRDHDSSSRFNMRYWTSQNLACLHQLMEVKIELSTGSNEWELARYILEHAQNLKKMVILYSPYQSDVEWMVRKIKTISNATVVLQKKHSI